MSKYQERLNSYPLFYEEIGRRSEHSSDQTKKEMAYEQPGGLNEDQLSKLSDDLRSPLRDSSSNSNPLQ